MRRQPDAHLRNGEIRCESQILSLAERTTQIQTLRRRAAVALRLVLHTLRPAPRRELAPRDTGRRLLPRRSHLRIQFPPQHLPRRHPSQKIPRPHRSDQQTLPRQRGYPPHHQANRSNKNIDTPDLANYDLFFRRILDSKHNMHPDIRRPPPCPQNKPSSPTLSKTL